MLLRIEMCVFVSKYVHVFRKFDLARLRRLVVKTLHILIPDLCYLLIHSMQSYLWQKRIYVERTVRVSYQEIKL